MYYTRQSKFSGSLYRSKDTKSLSPCLEFCFRVERNSAIPALVYCARVLPRNRYNRGLSPFGKAGMHPSKVPIHALMSILSTWPKIVRHAFSTIYWFTSIGAYRTCPNRCENADRIETVLCALPHPRSTISALSTTAAMSSIC